MRARRAMSDESVPRALVSLVRRNRRRYGGYIVHVGRRRAVRRGGGLVGFQHARDVALWRRAERQGRRLRRHLREADRRPRRGEQRPAREDRPRRPAARVARRQARRHAAHRARLLPHRGPDARAGLALLRGRGDERGRPAAPACGATSGRAVAPDIARAAAAASPRATRSSPRPGRCPRRSARSLLAQALRRADRARYATHPPPATFRLHRLAAGDLDLDRRADRVLRRADRALAGAPRARPARSPPATPPASAQELGRA